MLFIKQMNIIIAKNGYLLFIASIMILFLRIGKQIAKIAIFMFVYPFWAIAIDKQKVLFAPPPQKTNRQINEQHSRHFKTPCGRQISFPPF